MGEDLEEKVESAPVISYQNEHEAENLDVDVNIDKNKANDNDFA